MKLARIMAYGLIFWTAVACAAYAQNMPKGNNRHTQNENSLDEMRAQSLTVVDLAACDAKGGDVRQEGLLGLWQCVVSYGDAGNTCAAPRDCQGRCLAADDITDFEAPPGKAKGRCEADDSPFGCYAEINDGSLSAMLSVD
jgi:hypothetical protein